MYSTPQCRAGTVTIHTRNFIQMQENGIGTTNCSQAEISLNALRLIQEESKAWGEMTYSLPARVDVSFDSNDLGKEPGT